MKRVRQHVNPLSQKYQQPIVIPNWVDVYAQVNLPLHLDIGCGRGHFLLQMAQLTPDWNFLGLEIREPLVTEANQYREDLKLTNLHYLFCNANISIQPILASFSPGQLQRISLQFPDPWFKKRHHKRRVVNPELVEQIATYLTLEGQVFLQSDVEEVAQEMRDQFAGHPAFERVGEPWLSENPLPVPTERELATLAKPAPVYRVLFTKKWPVKR